MMATEPNAMNLRQESVLDQVLPGVIPDELTKKCLHLFLLIQDSAA